MIGPTEYRYEFQMIRNNGLPEYLKDCDYLDLWWAGFKLDPSEQVGETPDDEKNYI